MIWSPVRLKNDLYCRQFLKTPWRNNGTVDFAMLFACDDTPKPEAQDTDDSGSAAEDPITTPDSPSPLAEWAIYIFMNGDNDLESYVFYDLNELEEVGSSENVHVVVQADRSEDYWAGAGDWTDTRRYYITQDDNSNQVTSELVMSVGEADMGSATDLADFLTWAYTEYPAEKVAVIFGIMVRRGRRDRHRPISLGMRAAEMS